MAIVDYRSSTDIDIKFEDNTVLRHKTYYLFKNGLIKNPNYKPRIGETAYNNQGCLMKIIEYYNNKNITVQFLDEHKYIARNVNYANYRRGEVKNPYYKSYKNIGYLGNISETNIRNMKSYKTWCYMIDRCYPTDDLGKELHKSYADCTVCDEWLCFENFKKWYDKNYYEIPGEKMQLDKDIIVKRNRVYSPETCCFVPCNINHIFGDSKLTRGEYPMGVYFRKDRGYFDAKCNIDGKQIHLGCFKTAEDAFYAYKEFKEKRIKELADKYKKYLPEKTYDALYNWKIKITD